MEAPLSPIMANILNAPPGKSIHGCILRIVSLLPSATEIVVALGLEEELVGVSHECDFPQAAKFKPKMIEPVFDTRLLESERICCNPIQCSCPTDRAGV